MDQESISDGVHGKRNGCDVDSGENEYGMVARSLLERRDSFSSREAEIQQWETWASFSAGTCNFS